MERIGGLIFVLIAAGLGFILSPVLKEKFPMSLATYKKFEILFFLVWVLALFASAIPIFVTLERSFNEDVNVSWTLALIPSFIVLVVGLAYSYAYNRCSSCDAFLRRPRGSFERMKHCSRCGNELDW